ncbi:hypothetical protein GCM10009565_79650 [Amycolatopsis albidoflavus]
MSPTGVYDDIRRLRNWMSSPNSATIRLGNKLTRYEYRDNRTSTPGKARNDTAAPPISARRSSTATDRPARAR